MLAFVNEKTGKRRTIDGGFEDSFGRISFLDKLLEETKTFNEETLEKANNLLSENKENSSEQSSRIYLSILNKLVQQGSSYLTKEQERITKLLSGSLKPQARSKFFLRLNILKAFINNKEEL